MTDTPAPARKPTPPTRKPSAKTLARQLARYLNGGSGLNGSSSINDLLESLRSAIVKEEVGDDLNIFGS